MVSAHERAMRHWTRGQQVVEHMSRWERIGGLIGDARDDLSERARKAPNEVDSSRLAAAADALVDAHEAWAASGDAAAPVMALMLRLQGLAESRDCPAYRSGIMVAVNRISSDYTP